MSFPQLPPEFGFGKEIPLGITDNPLNLFYFQAVSDFKLPLSFSWEVSSHPTPPVCCSCTTFPTHCHFMPETGISMRKTQFLTLDPKPSWNLGAHHHPAFLTSSSPPLLPSLRKNAGAYLGFQSHSSTRWENPKVTKFHENHPGLGGNAPFDPALGHYHLPVDSGAPWTPKLGTCGKTKHSWPEIQQI